VFGEVVKVSRMEVFLGLVSRNSKIAGEIKKSGWGVVIVPELLTRFCPETFPLYFVDNGAFSCWKRGKRFDEKAFLKTLSFVSSLSTFPKFVVVPDKVAEGLHSLEFSVNWLEVLKRDYPHFSYALAVQDGMDEKSVEEVIEEFDYLFVGGTLKWKLQTGEKWVKLAHKHNKKCHIGRVGTAKRVRWVRRIKADSIDSSLPLFSKAKLEVFKRALSSPLLPELPLEVVD